MSKRLLLPCFFVLLVCFFIFSPKEVRGMCGADLAISADANNASSAMIGQPFTWNFNIANVAAIGYSPYIDIVLPAGADGDDGVDIVGASFGMLSLDTLIYPGGSTPIDHPYAETMTGPVQISLATGEQLAVIKLPFGSFSPGQNIDISLDFLIDEYADAGVLQTLSLNGGYAFGCDALDNPSTDPSLIGTSYDFAISPTIFTVNKTYQGPEDETATGPNYPRSYVVQVDIASGQTVTSFDITDYLPDTHVFQSASIDIPAVGGSFTTIPSTGSAQLPPNNELTASFASITGGPGAVDVEISIDYYIDEDDASGTEVINPMTGAPVAATNIAAGAGSWNPLDPRDTPGIVSGTGTEVTTLKSLALQKSRTNISAGGSINRPGDIIEYTLNFQISDFFTYDNIIIDDVAEDGLRIDTSFTPTFTITDRAGTVSGSFMSGTSYIYDTSEIGNDVNPITDGSVTLTFDIGQALTDEGAADTILQGGRAMTPDATSAGGTIVYRMIIQDTFTDTYQSGDPSVDVGDILNNTTTIVGDVLSNSGFVYQGTGSDTSSRSITVNDYGMSKEIYAVNGSTGFSLPLEVAPGDIVTWRITFNLASSDVENLVVTDYLPLPVFDATEVATFDILSIPAIPLAGTANFGPSDTLHTLLAPAVYPGAPTIVINTGSNVVSFDYGNFDDPNNRSSVVDILFSTTVADQQFGNGLSMTNLATVEFSSTLLTSLQSSALAQIQLQEPELSMTKGVVEVDNPGGVFSPVTVGPISFDGSGCPAIVSTLDSDGLTTDPVDSNLSNILPEDLVTYAIVIENEGDYGAYDIRLQDTLPSDMLIPSGGINLCITRGDNTVLAYTLSGGAAATESDLFGSGIQITNLASGAIDAYKATGGANIAVLTYQLEVGTGVYPEKNIINTATIQHFAGVAGGSAYDVNGLSDTATITLEDVVANKDIVDTSETTTLNRNVVVGEEVQYQVTFALPEQTQADNVMFEDRLDPGLTFVSIDSISHSGTITTSLTGGLPAQTGAVVYSLANRRATIDLGTITNTDTNTGTTESIIITYTALVGNNATITNGLTRNNRADYIRDTDSATNYARDTAPNVTVREPLLQVDKVGTSNPLSTGLVYTYTIDITHAGASTEDAFDVVLTDDLLAQGLDYVSGSYMVNGIMPGFIDFSSGLVARYSGLSLGGSGSSISFDVTFPGWSGEVLVDNTATATWTSISGANANERTGAGGIDDYSADGTYSLVFHICSIDGYIYLDINDNDIYNPGIDEIRPLVPVTLQTNTGLVLDTGTTNASGYYLFTGTNCISDFEVTYSVPGDVVDDSAQNEQTNQQGSSTVISVPSTDFASDYMSDNNNFGVLPPERCYSTTAIPSTGYDLLDLSSLSCQGQGSTYYSLVITQGPSTIVTYTGYSSTVMTSSVAFTTGLVDLTSGVYTLTCTVGTTTSPACSIPLNVEYCGDGTSNGGETCDDGNSTTSDTCDTYGTTPNSMGTCTYTFCGDGVTQSPNGVGTLGVTGNGDEACDDGANGDDTDGCTDSCILTYCGDTVVQNPNGEASGGTTDSGDEECDVGTGGDSTCYGTIPSATGAIACTLTICGDSVVQAPNGSGFAELCDDGANGDDMDSCTDSCTLTTCGDGIVQGPNGVGTGGATGIGDEECDDANADEFDNCTSSCVIQLCQIDGYVYLDIADNDIYNIGLDGVFDAIPVTLNGTTGTVTDVNGYYLFTGLDCTSAYTVTYPGIAGYASDSAQFVYSGQQASSTSISVPTSSFQDVPLYSSPDNNFGVTSYDLYVSQTVDMVDTNVFGPVLNWSGDLIQYSLSLGNIGPSTAYGSELIYSYTPSEIDVQSINVGSLGSLSGVVLTTGAGTITISNIPVLASGDAYIITIDALTYGSSGDLIQSIASIYTASGTSDAIEASSTNAFTNNISTGTVMVEKVCRIDGNVYLDIDNNNIYGGPDIPSPIVGITVTATDGSGAMLNILGQATTTTTTSGATYTFDYLDCSQDWEVRYDTLVGGILDSSQHESTIQQPSPFDVISIPASSFDTVYGPNRSISTDNNFDVNLYDLNIETSMSLGNGSYAKVKGGTVGTFSITISNIDSGVVSGSTMTYAFDGSFDPDVGTLNLGGLPGGDISWTADMLTISNIPPLYENDTYTIIFDATLIKGIPGTHTNLATIYVGTPETDPAEDERFSNNRAFIQYLIKSKGHISSITPSTGGEEEEEEQEPEDEPEEQPPVDIEELDDEEYEEGEQLLEEYRLPEEVAFPEEVAAIRELQNNIKETIAERTADAEGFDDVLLPFRLPTTGSELMCVMK